MARVEHSCWLCDRSPYHGQQMVSAIYPGERYWGEVFVGDRGWEVRDYHFCCPFDPIEEDMGLREDEPDDEVEEESLEEWLPLAA